MDGDPVSNLQIAHIYPAKPRGPRDVSGMHAADRKAFVNLILLCHPHHTIVDKRRPQDFPVETLQKWKAEREKDHEAALDRLTGVTQEGLQEVFAAVLQDRDQKLNEVLQRLEQSDAEAAQLLQSLIDEISELRHSRYVDSGITEEFANAANNLYRVFSSGLIEEFIHATHRLPPQ